MEELFSNQTAMFIVSSSLAFSVIYFIYIIVIKVNNIISTSTNLTSLTSYLIFGVICVFFGDLVNTYVKSLYSFATFPLLANVRNSNILLKAVTEVENGTYEFMIGDGVLGIGALVAIWALICWLTSIIKDYVTNQISKNPTTDLFDLYMTKAFLITFFFITALFLVISSIVAVPEFQSIQTNNTFDQLEEDFNSDLAKRLDSIVVPDLQFNIDQAHQKLDSIQNGNQNASKLKDIKISPRNTLSQGKLQIQNKYSWLVDSMAVEYNTLAERVSLFRENQRPALSYAYLTEALNGLSERNRNAYRVQLITASINQTYSIVQRMKAIRGRFIMWYNSAGADHLYPISIKNTTQEIQSVKKLLGIVPAKAPDTSTGLGIFGFMSNWLLKTRSISLALIAGMFGFGLLGAIASSFIRQRMIEPDIKKKSTQQIVDDIDLRTILITGVTAAVIIFLSVKGALIILTTPDNAASINPYILFFICFSASLYNEVVWKWVIDRFNAYLNNSPENNGNQQNSSTIISKNPVDTAGKAPLVES